MSVSNLSDSDLLDLYSKAILNKRNSNLVYLGSPTALTWADYPDGTNRGWFEVDTEFNTCKLHANNVDQSLFCVFNHNPETKYHEMDLKVINGKIARVIVNDKGDTRSFNKFLSLLASAGAIEYKIIDNTTVKVDQTNTSLKAENLLLNMATVISEYTFNLAGTVEGANPETVKSMTVDIYNRANNGETK